MSILNAHCGEVHLKSVISNIHQDLFVPIIVGDGYAKEGSIGWTSNSWNSVPDGDDFGWVAKLLITMAAG